MIRPLDDVLDAPRSCADGRDHDVSFLPCPVRSATHTRTLTRTRTYSSRMPTHTDHTSGVVSETGGRGPTEVRDDVTSSGRQLRHPLCCCCFLFFFLTRMESNSFTAVSQAGILPLKANADKLKDKVGKTVTARAGANTSP